MLKLVSQPDTSYEDIAALMGLSVGEVRAKVDGALAELDSGGKAAPEPAPDPVPDPIPAPPTPLPPAPEAKPEPAVATPNPAAAKPAPASGPRSGRPKLPEDKGARYGLFAGGAVVVLLVLLLVTGVLGDDDDSAGGTSATEGTTATNASNGPEATQAVLTAVDGSDADGRALFGRAGKNVVLLVRAKGLEPAPQGQSYTVSLAKSPGERVPLIATKANGKGEIGGSFQIAPQILGLLASGYDQMEISLIPNKALGTALKAAQKEGKAPAYSGTDILSGEVTGPIVEVGDGG